MDIYISYTHTLTINKIKIIIFNFESLKKKYPRKLQTVFRSRIHKFLYRIDHNITLNSFTKCLKCYQ